MQATTVVRKSGILVLVRGAGDVGSAVAHRLFGAGYGVLMHDEAAPTTSRRKMAFTDALFEGQATLQGVTAILVASLADLSALLNRRTAIPVTTAPINEVLHTHPPTVLVDARMRKRAQPEIQRSLAALTIGLGPNFVAGETTDLAVETGYGADLGRVLTSGATRPLEGEPRAIAGYARERFIYAPCAGQFRTEKQIGQPVQTDEPIAHIGATVLRAPLSGVLRGLTHDGVPVAVGTKVIEIDPRGDQARISGIGERPARIADGVLVAVEQWLGRR